jgi:hypothetical protein
MPFNIQSRLVAATIYSQGLFISRYENPILRVLNHYHCTWYRGYLTFIWYRGYLTFIGIIERLSALVNRDKVVEYNEYIMSAAMICQTK